MDKLKVGSLFSGIGGIELGLERSGGFSTQWHVEIESFPSAILAKHWPAAQLFGDVKDFPPESHKLNVDMVIGGFPCCDVSNAMTAQMAPQGLAGKKSGLWYQYARILGILKPRWSLIENVGVLNVRGLLNVLSDLNRIGYDAEWATLSAAAFGRLHLRKRVFIVAALRGSGAMIGLLQQPRKPAVKDPDYAGTKILGEPKGRPKQYKQRLMALGNAVVPDCSQFVGARIMDSVRSKPEGTAFANVAGKEPRVSGGFACGFYPEGGAPEYEGDAPPAGFMRDGDVYKSKGWYLPEGSLYRTPTARDWKGMSARKWRERTKGDKTPTLADQLGGLPHPEFVEYLMGFPAGWTDLSS